MRTTARPRHYWSRLTVLLVRPLFRYSTSRDAYVLRFAGNRAGPVLKPDRRRRGQSEFKGRDRRSDGHPEGAADAQETDIL